MSANRDSLALRIVAVVAVVSAAVIFYLPAQLFVFETVDYLPHYLGDGPLWKKVFDPFSTDLEKVYRGRELANLFNYLDAVFLEFCASRGRPHSVSIVHCVGLLVISVLHLGASRHFLPRRAAFASFMLLLLFLLSPAAFLWVTYFRTSKLLVGLCLVVSVRLVADLGEARMPGSIGEAVRSSAGRLSALFAASSAMGLSDEQGVFFLWVLLCGAFAACLLTRRNNERVVFFAMAAGMSARFLYVFAVGPALIHAATGRSVDVFGSAGGALDLMLLAAFVALAGALGAHMLSGPGRQERTEGAARRLLGAGGGMPLLGLLVLAASASAQMLDYPIWKGVLNLLDTAGFFFGNTGRIGGACVLLLGAAAAPGPRRGAQPVESCARSFFVFGAVSVAVMNAIMIKKHPPVFYEDIGRIYYPFPASALLLVTGTFVLGALERHRPAAQKFVTAGLCLLAVSSVFAIPRHKQILMGGFFKRAFEVNPAILECIRRTDADVDAFGLSPGAKRHCMIFRLSRKN